MICHPSYPYVWDLRHSCDVGSQAPPLSLMYVEKIGEPGDEATITSCSHRIAGLDNYVAMETAKHYRELQHYSYTSTSYSYCN